MTEVNCSLLEIGSDDHTQNWCKLVATVSTPFCSVIVIKRSNVIRETPPYGETFEHWTGLEQ